MEYGTRWFTVSRYWFGIRAFRVYWRDDYRNESGSFGVLSLGFIQFHPFSTF